MKVITKTDRLILRELTVDDAGFIYELMNTPGWIKHIGDRGIRTLDDARNYLTGRLIASYKVHGFGLYHTSIQGTGEPIGICGLVKRESLNFPDIGFAFLPQFMGQGFAFEAARSILDISKSLQVEKVVAITSSKNLRSQKLLDKIGLKFRRTIKIPDYDGDNYYYE